MIPGAILGILCGSALMRVTAWTSRSIARFLVCCGCVPIGGVVALVFTGCPATRLNSGVADALWPFDVQALALVIQALALVIQARALVSRHAR